MPSSKNINIKEILCKNDFLTKIYIRYRIRSCLVSPLPSPPLNLEEFWSLKILFNKKFYLKKLYL